MKYVKMLGLLAVAATALMAFASAAVAGSTLTSPEGETYTGNIVATSTNSELSGSFITVKCSHSEAKGKVEQHGSENAGGKVTSLTFSECNYKTTVKNEGTLEISSTGTVTSKGAGVEIETSVGTCVFTTNATTGTTVGSLTEGKGASMDINSASIPRTSGSFLCGGSGTWNGSYDLTTPNDLWVD
jgi:hypothetical protein